MTPIDILLVEDNAGDVRLTQEALKDCKVLNTLHVVGDGVEALDFLHKRGQYTDARRPDLILLDINLPKKNGHAVLEHIKTDDHLKLIPVVMLTTSSSEEDVLRSYRMHANCYIVKPVRFEEFMDVIRGIEDFWLSLVKLPRLI